MKKLVLSLVLTMLAALPAAQALTIDFDSTTPAGVVFSGDCAIVQGSVNSYYATPYGDTSKYYATYSASNPYASSESTISLGGVFNKLSFIWGSVDSYNTLELVRNGKVVKSVSGATALPPGSGDQGVAGTMTYTTAGVSFDSIQFLTGTNSFEVDNIKVSSTSAPDGGTTAVLLGLAMVSLVAVRSKFGVV